MANAATKSMQQMEELKNILLAQNMSMGVQIIDMVQESFKTMDIQHQILYKELQDVRAQLDVMQKGMNNLNPRQQRAIVQTKSTPNQFLTGIENKVSGMGTYISQMKKSIGEKAAGVAKDFKARGVIALDNIADKLGVKEYFKRAEKHFNREAIEIQRSIDKIDAVSREINSAKTHAGNIVRAMGGKELKEVPEKQGKMFALLSSYFKKSLNSTLNCRNKAHDFVVGLEKLQVRALDAQDHLRNKSVLKQLDSNKNDLNEQTSENPLEHQEQKEDPAVENPSESKGEPKQPAAENPSESSKGESKQQPKEQPQKEKYGNRSEIIGYYKREKDNTEYIHYIHNGEEHLTNGICDWRNNDKEKFQGYMKQITKTENIDLDCIKTRLEARMPYHPVIEMLKQSPLEKLNSYKEEQSGKQPKEQPQKEKNKEQAER